MNVIFNRKQLGVWLGLFLATRLFAADTNQTAGVTHEELANNFLQVQEQLHATQLAIVLSQQVAADTTKSNVDMLAAKLQSLEQTVATQHSAEADSAHRTQQMTLAMAGSFGLAGLGILLLMVYFQWRAFTQLAQITTQQHLIGGGSNGDLVHQLAAPGRAVVESSNTKLLDAVDQLQKRIHELENGQRLLPETPRSNGANGSNGSNNNATFKSSGALMEGQKFLETDAPQKALEAFEGVLAAHPNNAEALVKKAEALEKLGRDEEALAHYNRAIAADGALVIAHLHKGGLLNRLRRYDEALNCYEQALTAQDKKLQK